MGSYSEDRKERGRQAKMESGGYETKTEYGVMRKVK